MTVSRRVAIVEDDAALAEGLATLLRQAGHISHSFNDGIAAVRTLRRESFDLIILDWNLPGLDGLEITSWVRQNLEGTVPILFVTSRDRETDIVDALGHGADDYVVKPVRPSELVARVSALIRRSYPVEESDVLVFFDHKFDRKMGTVHIDGDAKEVLTDKELELAILLFQNLDRALSRAYIMEHVWGIDPNVASRTLDVHISRIRKKLKLRPQFGYRLSPVYSYGYRLERSAGEGCSL